jgi:hypothetical protein
LSFKLSKWDVAKTNGLPLILVTYIKRLLPIFEGKGTSTNELGTNLVKIRTP